MGVIRTILLVLFVIICILLILMVLVQNDEGNGMGSIYGGQSAAFGSHSASVLSKTTGVFVGAFFAIVFAFMLLSKDMAGAKVLTEAAKAQETTSAGSTGGSWIDDEEVSADNAVIEAVEDSEVPALETEVPAAE